MYLYIHRWPCWVLAPLHLSYVASLPDLLSTFQCSDLCRLGKKREDKPYYTYLMWRPCQACCQHFNEATYADWKKRGDKPYYTYHLWRPCQACCQHFNVATYADWKKKGGIHHITLVWIIKLFSILKVLNFSYSHLYIPHPHEHYFFLHYLSWVSILCDSRMYHCVLHSLIPCWGTAYKPPLNSYSLILRNVGYIKNKWT